MNPSPTSSTSNAIKSPPPTSVLIETKRSRSGRRSPSWTKRPDRPAAIHLSRPSASKLTTPMRSLKGCRCRPQQPVVCRLSTPFPTGTSRSDHRYPDRVLVVRRWRLGIVANQITKCGWPCIEFPAIMPRIDTAVEPQSHLKFEKLAVDEV